jgi:hypothetical protein
MPNHVDMDLVVSGDTESLHAFIAFAKEGESILSANKFIPYPNKYRLMDMRAETAKQCGDLYMKDGFNSGGYEWCVSNWGTKWGIYGANLVGTNLKDKKGKLEYACQSAWEPPLPVIIAMSKEFPTLKFSLKYYEHGMGFKGTYVAKAGSILKETTSKYSGNRGG